jgi:hypothetical protein
VLPVLPVALVIVAAGCGNSGRKSEPLARWLTYSARQQTVVLTLVPGANNVYDGFNFNGYGKGQVLVQVPRGWRIVVRCSNTVSRGRHSCAIVKGTEATAPSFPGASSPDPQAGLPPGRTASFSFRATRPGSYRIACLLPEHERAGMWDVLEIGSARLPSVTLLRAYP